MRAMNRQMRRQLERSNFTWPVLLVKVPKEQWNVQSGDPLRREVWRSRDYLVQVFAEAAGTLRISVNRTHMRPDGRWADDLSWDELQSIKRQIGAGDRQAIEVYPADRDIVNVANMRHLWLPLEPVTIGWFATRAFPEPKREEVPDAAV